MLEYVPAVEHFAGHKNAQIFLMADFEITCLGKTSHIERCLACYPEKRADERSEMMAIANQRLKLLYEDFERASVKYSESFYQ
jgi:hypothetical protein